MWKILMSFLFLAVAVGCSTKNNIDNSNRPSEMSIKNSAIDHVDRKTGQEVSKRLVMLATRIPNVEDATAVVLGPYAIVGIDVNSKLDRSQVGSIKYSVAESLRKDPYGAKSIVVADVDTNQRLKEIASEIKKGRPGQGIMQELADIASRLMPEVPGDLLTPNPKNATDRQDNKLPQNDQNKLKHQQEEQSNHKK